MRINLNEGQLSAIFFLISSGIGISLSIGGHFGWAWLILILSSALYLVFASDVFRRLAARNPRVNALAPPTQGWNHMRFSIIVIGGFCSCFPLVMMILLLNAKIAFDIEAISGSLKGSQADIFHLDAVAFTFFI